jgi:transcriptional regulator with GAF, ATPase, and Fis domain
MGDSQAGALSVPWLCALAHAVAEAADLDAACAAVAQGANTAIGHRLFTVMRFDAAAMQVQRLYSSDPAAYPPGVRKAKRDTWWGRHVLEQGRPYIGRDADDIRAHFVDHAIIAGFGLAAILNVPVRVCGRTVGTMNLLHVAGHYAEQHVPAGRMLAALLAAPLLAWRAGAAGDA